MNTLAFQPEPLQSMRARYNQAIAKVVTSLDDPAKEMAALGRRHVFDFEDGVRLVIRRQRARSGEICLVLTIGTNKSLPDTLSVFRTYMGAVGHFKELCQLDPLPTPFAAYATDKSVSIFIKENPEAQ